MKSIATKCSYNQILQQVLISWPLFIGFLAMYLPTYFALSTTVWNTEDQAHGPLILFVCLYLVWEKRDSILALNINEVPKPVSGYIFLFIGLVMYVLGRSQDIFLLDVGSQIPVIIGILLITRGFSILKTFWFPLFFLFFLIPLPSIFVDSLTLPMKIAVSYVADFILYNLGYPIARSGVVLQIGQFQLLVANACAGLHTLFSLEALGLLYLNLVKHDSVVRNFVLASLIIPISFTANVTRVIILVLITYYFGNEAGQGFIHGFAGMVLFIVALALIIAVDSAIQLYVKRSSGSFS